jgi:hypothetical protein
MAKREVQATIVGLGRVGGAFLKKLIEQEGKGIKIVAAAERDENAEGVQLAKDKGIRLYNEGREIVGLGGAVDIIFDFTGNPEEKANLRVELARTGNDNTVIAPVVISEFIWDIMAPNEDFPGDHQDKGY